MELEKEEDTADAELRCRARNDDDDHANTGPKVPLLEITLLPRA
jgi:hypothetical protein